MFKSESTFQELIHNRPEIVLSGIPEVNPNLCPDTPAIVSLGREVSLASGPIDNLYIDTNAILTFVECKRYSDTRIKREVHSQVVNYAADLQGMLTHYSGDDFVARFIEIVKKADGTRYTSMDLILDDLSKDPILENRNINDWKRQFLERLEFNIKQGICRIVIACAPDPQSNFSYTQIRNLMKLMQFSESPQSNYDLILMDIRKSNENFESKIIWRSYAALPLIPLIANSNRDTSQQIEDLHNTIENLDDDIKSQLEEFISLLDTQGIYTKDNTSGFALYWQDTHKSLYVRIGVTSKGWCINRHQIRTNEELFQYLEKNNPPADLQKFSPGIKETNGVHGAIIDLVIETTAATNLQELAQLVRVLLAAKQQH